MRSLRTLIYTFLFSACPLLVWAQPTASVHLVHIQAERLPDMNVARDGNAVFCLGGELTVIGGHTNGFVPTQMAEYLKDGAWHTISTVYAHDYPLAVNLSSGNVLVGGGQDNNFGIGQTFSVERYDPMSHSFEGFGCFDQKRTLASGVELDSGRVLIAGNWYADDRTEMFDGRKFFHPAGDVTQQRVSPYMFRIGRDEALIFGDRDVCDQYPDSIIVDRLHGKSFSVPLLSHWRPMASPIPNRSSDCFIGDAGRGDWSYIFPVRNYKWRGVEVERGGEPAGQMAFVLVHDTVFTLLPTVCPVPMRGVQDLPIVYSNSTPIIDRATHRLYMIGYDTDKRLYILALDYSLRPAPLTLYHTDPLPECGFGAPVLTDEGDIAIIGGGVQEGFVSDNFKPFATAFLVRIGQHEGELQTILPHWWVWLVVFIALLLAVSFFVLHRRRTRHGATLPADGAGCKPFADEVLMERICRLMDEEQPFRNSELKASQVAAALDTNARYVIGCIRTQRNQTFTQFVNAYRVEYAKKLLRDAPDQKLLEVYTAAGFSSDTSFFRIFKAHTGLSPREWVMQDGK